MWRVSHPAKDEHMLARGSRREQAPLNFGKVLSDVLLRAAQRRVSTAPKKNDAGGAFAVTRWEDVDERSRQAWLSSHVD
jgi:hypothetical protein